ncbi:S8 family peptidase [Clostridium beijerinckii]|uniref:Subtilisin family serine protease n=1 Tax=Clostridium beijerinckii TaxID=1520 RepID=A0AAE5H8T1_CLOBE|nr:S8 family peptidase [Clostridium beijerinckii]NSB16818.1 subtilisin family serine protease [Clostridium beijerinckii]OOM31425.1 subtilase family protein [Clostridium beijerinckii]
MSDLRDCNLYYDPDSANYLIEYRGNFKEQIDKLSYACGDIITGNIGVISVRNNDFDRLLNDVPAIVFYDFRTIYVLQDISPSSVDNINNIKINPFLDLNGRGVLIGIVDTGIDYLNDEFIREDDTSRIISIWDQSVQSNTSDSVYIGQIYSNDQINSAIAAKRNNGDPYQIVPSRDEVGHGTKVAGIIGARGYNTEFQGIANASDFVIVKLLESTNFKRQLQENGIPYTPVYNASEIVAGVEYLRRVAVERKQPMVIYLGVGSTEGSHDGNNLISRYITSIGNSRGLCVVNGVGNEGDSQGHVSGYIRNVGDTKVIELRIPREIKYLPIYIWIRRPNIASINVISPTGEASAVIQSKINKVQPVRFVFLNTDMSVRFYSPEHFTGHQVISLTFSNIKPGTWTFNLIGEYITNGRYDIWLPPKSTLPENTIFLESDPFTTLTIPATAVNVITVSYYGNNNALIAASGKGFNTNGLINPDISTIGVNILTTKVGGGVTTFSGSSAATAVVVGACALLLQWGIVDRNDPTMYTKKIRTYIMYGANRNSANRYPSRETGYGDFDLLGVFNIISGLYRNSNQRFRMNITDKKYTNEDYEFDEYYINKLFIRIPKAGDGKFI